MDPLFVIVFHACLLFGSTGAFALYLKGVEWNEKRNQKATNANY